MNMTPSVLPTPDAVDISRIIEMVLEDRPFESISSLV
jgi:hypothetical protein